MRAVRCRIRFASAIAVAMITASILLTGKQPNNAQQVDGDRCIKSLAIHGGAAKPLLPRLRQLEQDIVKHSEAMGLQPRIDSLRELMRSIKSTKDAPELIHLTS